MNMRRSFSLLFVGLILAGCAREKGAPPLIRGPGFGYDWNGAASKEVLRVSVQNSFTRDVFVALDGEGRHYELKVGPVRDGFMIVPRGNYKYSAWSFGDSLGEIKHEVLQNDRDGISGVLVRIRP